MTVMATVIYLVTRLNYSFDAGYLITGCEHNYGFLQKVCNLLVTVRNFKNLI